MNWEELLKEVNAKLAEALQGKTVEEQKQILSAFTDKLHQDARQYSFNKGHSTAKTEVKTEIDGLTADKTRLEGEVAKRDQTITALQEKNPNLDKVRQDNEAALTAKDSERKRQVEALTTRIKQQAVDAFAAKVQNALTTRETDPVHPRAAKYFVRDLVEAGRIKASDVTIKDDGTIEGGEVSLYQKDGKTPFAAPENAEAHAGFASAVHAEVDKQDIISNVGGGPGENRPGGGGKDATYYENLRKETEQAAPDGDATGKLVNWDREPA